MRDVLQRASALLLAPLVLGGVTLTGACSSDETVVGDLPPTEIAVDPLEFLGDLPCSEDEGAAQAYVAAATDEDQGFTLGAAPPSPCTTRVAFRYVVVGHAYTADVDVYDRPASELTPAGGEGSGSRVMLDASGAVVQPQWRTRCGVGAAGPAIALDDASVVVAGCEPLDGRGSADTALVVDPSDALGRLACTGEDGGEVDAVRVVPSGGPGGAALPTVTVACGAAPVVYAEGIQPGATYRFRLEGLAAAGDDEARWGASCVVVASEGVARRATCEPLASTGAIVVAAPDEAPGFVCGIDYDAFDLRLEGAASLSVPRTACTGEVRLAPVPAGRYEGTLRTFEADPSASGGGSSGQVERTARCEVAVAPGETAPLLCTFQ
jgi:hypothetical protein